MLPSVGKTPCHKHHPKALQILGHDLNLKRPSSINHRMLTPSPLFSTISTTANGDIGQTQPITNGGQQIVAQPRRGILNAKSNKDLLPSIGQSKLPEKHVTFSSDAETFRIPKGQPSSNLTNLYSSSTTFI